MKYVISLLTLIVILFTFMPAETKPSFPGTYAWVGGQTLVIHPNQTVEVFLKGKKINDGRWEVLDASARRYRLVHRQGGYIDTVTLSSDGRNLTGTNNRGNNLRGRLISRSSSDSTNTTNCRKNCQRHYDEQIRNCAGYRYGNTNTACKHTLEKEKEACLKNCR